MATREIPYAENLNKLVETKQGIKGVLQAYADMDTSTPFAEYPDYIQDIDKDAMLRGFITGSTTSSTALKTFTTNASTIKARAFQGITTLVDVTIMNCSRIYPSAFSGCTALKYVYLPGSSVCQLGTNVFTGVTLNAIYVPASLVTDYKAATNWSVYSAKINALS